MDSVLGFVPYWDLYYYNNYSLHVQYSNTKDCIELITLESLKFKNDFLAE
jgi:hypothetical protein